MALTILVGALPFYISPAHASVYTMSQDSSSSKNRWLDDYHTPVGFTYGVKASINTTYLWRGLNCGALNIQPSANIGYGGLYAEMWWNIGTTDWQMKTFLPEMDISVGFARWGVNVYVVYIHNFDCGLFDFSNRSDGTGNRLEVDLRYTVSSKLPLSFLWASRVCASDGYWNSEGKWVRAYSSYAEISYTHTFPYELSLYGAIGITPWRGIYTYSQNGFEVCNIEVRLRKDWELSARCGLALQGAFAIHPSGLAADPSTAHWKPYSPGNQTINANIGVEIYLK